MLLQFPLLLKKRLDRLPLLVPAALLVLIYSLLYIITIGRDSLNETLYSDKIFNSELLTYILVGIGAQLIDGALGMAYGVSASSFLMSVGVHPAAASAAVHVSEVFTTGASGLSHLTF